MAIPGDGQMNTASDSEKENEDNFDLKGGSPSSKLYGEGYYGFEDGLGESRYVFLDGNHLREPKGDSKTIVVAETGFGTALNLLSLLHRRASWTSPPPLHFISVERHPLTLGQYNSCHGNWPELEPWRSQLSEQWPEEDAGWHHLELSEDITVDIFHGPVSKWFDNFPKTKVNHWFLDGFSPAKNPEMWTDELFKSMSQYSDPKASLATFTAAGFIRRGLKEVGFNMKRIKGYGMKREMLTGVFEQPAQNDLYP